MVGILIDDNIIILKKQSSSNKNETEFGAHSVLLGDTDLIDEPTGLFNHRLRLHSTNFLLKPFMQFSNFNASPQNATT